MTSDEQDSDTPDRVPHTVPGGGSPVVLGYLLVGRSPAERVEFLAEVPPPAQPSPDGPPPRIYRNYTRRLRKE